MAIIVEDGTGIANANSYAGATEADTYFSDRAVSAWTGTQKEAALIRATAYLDAVYGLRAVGQPYPGNALAWPRLHAWDRYGVPLVGLPLALKQACFEAALLALSQDLLPPSERAAVVMRERVGNVEREYSGGSAATTYQIVDRLMQPLLRCGARITR